MPCRARSRVGQEHGVSSEPRGVRAGNGAGGGVILFSSPTPTKQVHNSCPYIPPQGSRDPEELGSWRPNVCLSVLRPVCPAHRPPPWCPDLERLTAVRITARCRASHPGRRCGLPKPWADTGSVQCRSGLSIYRRTSGSLDLCSSKEGIRPHAPVSGRQLRPGAAQGLPAQ